MNLVPMVALATAVSVWSLSIFPDPSELQGRVAVEIGGPDGHERPYRFLDPSSMALGPDGRIYVAESRWAEIRAFDSEGRHVFTVDPQAEGPRPFQNVHGIVFDGEGRLWVESGGVRDVLSLDGPRTLERTRFTPSPAQRAASSARVVGGRVVILGSDPRAEEGDAPGRALLSVAPSGEVEVLHTVPALSSERTRIMVATNPRQGPNVRRELPIPFSGFPMWATGPDGTVARAMSGRYEILRTGPDGQPLPPLTPPVLAPIPITEADRERWLEPFLDQGFEFEGLDFPDAHPPIRAMAFDSAGRLWVELTRPAERAERMAHVFGTDGSLLHVARWPADVVLLGGRIRPLLLEDRAWGLRELPGSGQQVVRIDWEP